MTTKNTENQTSQSRPQSGDGLAATSCSTIDQIRALCEGIEYSRDVPGAAKKLAADEGYVIIVGGSDDLMYAYGADCYLTDYIEHGYGWDGNTLTDISDKQLQREAEQIGLMIFWCGEIKNTNHVIEGYNTKESGAFSYTVKEGIESRDFKVLERDGDVYCTGKVIKLPDGFVSHK